MPQRSLVGKSGDAAWIGRVIASKYVVESVLGRGGMGLVLKARHLRLDEPVAIKVMHESVAKDPTMTARLLREARAALRLQSDHTVRLLDVDVLDDGAPYLVLELLEGIDLATLCKKRGKPMTAEQAVAIADQMCRALAEAHAMGIVHRDVKPANLFIVSRPDGRRIVKLLDFGVSRATRSDEIPVTRPGDIVGSPKYMSPEQVIAGEVDGRSDLWAAGVLLYELLSGKLPFRSDHLARACQSIMKDTPVSLSVHRPDLPAGLVAAVMRCLEKDREKRFPDAGALREALAPFGPIEHRNATQSALPDISMALSEDPAPKPRPAEAPAFAPLPTPLPVSVTPPSIAEATPAGAEATAAGAEESGLFHDATTLVRPDPSSTAVVEAQRRRSFVPIALAALLLGAALGLGVLVWGTPSAPDPSRSNAVDVPSTPMQGAPATLLSARAALSAPTTIVLPKGSTDAEPSLEPPSAKSARPAASTSAKAWPRTTTDPFGQQRH